MKLNIVAAIIALLGVSVSSAFAQGVPPTEFGSTSASASSWLAGAQAGYNWQQGAWVYGLTTDISATHLRSNSSIVLPGSFAIPANVGADIDWYGTVRGRLGWSSGPVLLYGTGGLAYGRTSLSSSLSAPPVSLSAQTSSVRTGWVAGGGIEYLWRPNLILSLDYQYVDLGTVGVASSTGVFGGGTAASSLNANAHGQFQAVTAGLSWLFYPTGHGPWEGGYVGGHVGGAWGNDTNASFAFYPGVPSDIRLKRNIVLVGRLDNGLGLYRYRYLWSDTVYVGVMAQEVALVRPDAIIRDDIGDYLRVDYRRLGLKLMTLPEWQAASKGERL
jgi:outer membrane immunogenic protein